MNRHKLLIALFATVVGTAFAQPRYDYTKLKTESLNRGVIAVPTDDGKVAISWRTLRSDVKGRPYNVFRNGVKLNDNPLTSGGTMFIDEKPLDGVDATYDVVPADMTNYAEKGSFTVKADAQAGFIALDLQKPEGVTTPDGFTCNYTANDCSVGDVDGDGEYEIFVKWDPSNAKDNSHPGFTGPTYIDCYKLNGQRLWRIDLGRNIRSGAHYVQFIVYDFDGDGRAEMMVKTADGTRDGQGNVIGDSLAEWRFKADNATQIPSRQQMRQRGRRPQFPRVEAKEGRILDGPEYISVFDGQTGRVMDTKPYVPERGDVRAWGDDRGNRSERYLAGMGFFGGNNASGVFCRGYYTRTVIAVWDWDGRELKNRWTFDTNNKKWQKYAGQGNHNLRIADVDGDGKDEVTYGSMAVDHDGRGLYNTGFGHGDALHLMAFDPKSDKLQLWDCHENKRDGSDFRDAKTGKVIFQIKSSIDVGRAMAADIDPTNEGVEMWSTDSHGIRNIKGELVKRGNSSDEDNTKLVIKGRYLPVNFGIWWDGDLLRELLDHERVYKYNWNTVEVDVIKQFDGRFNNGTKSNPCLSADILGDWREEVIVRNDDSSQLRIYTTTIPTDYRITCLMQDIPYRNSVAAENVGYNQPPEVGFYLGAERKDYGK